MGRNKSKYYKRTLHQQAYDKLQGMIAFGESKTNAKRTEQLETKYIQKVLIRRIKSISIILSNIL